MTFDDEPPPEPREGWLLVRVFVPELNVHKSLQFPSDKIVWDVKQQCLASLPKSCAGSNEFPASHDDCLSREQNPLTEYTLRIAVTACLPKLRHAHVVVGMAEAHLSIHYLSIWLGCQ
uniref:Uncharacterized protein n=1 Tax=Anopheles culicifacies TaxID=139723 RepID=A0A182M7L1_9DIPT